MDIVSQIVILISGLIALVFSANLFIKSASSLAYNFGLSKTFVAITILAFGTCSPELTISFVSVLKGQGDIVLANVLGSNIVNILLMLGIPAVAYGINIKKEATRKEIPFLILISSIFILLITKNIFKGTINPTFTQNGALILIVIFIVFMIYLKSTIKNQHQDKEKAEFDKTRSIIYCIISLILVGIGGYVVVESAVRVAEIFSLSQKIITMTIVVIGTSLPELILTAIAAKRKEYEMALGNIIGTNIFNLGIVFGLPIAIFGNITIQEFNLIDLGIFIICPFLLWVLARSDKKITKKEGILLLLLFFIYYVNMLFF